MPGAAARVCGMWPFGRGIERCRVKIRRSIAGKMVFNICANCHQVGPSARAGFGPQLNGIIGRAAGSTSDYRYSAAMRSAGFVWTEDRLRAFVKDPDAVVPGNEMRFFGIHNERDMRDLIAYLRTLQ